MRLFVAFLAVLWSWLCWLLGALMVLGDWTNAGITSCSLALTAAAYVIVRPIREVRP